MRTPRTMLLLIVLSCGLLVIGSQSLAMRDSAPALNSANVYTPLITEYYPALTPATATASTTATPTLFAGETQTPGGTGTITTTETATLTETETATLTWTPTASVTATETATTTATATASSTPTSTPQNNNDLLEPFEGAIGNWQVQRDTAGGGTVTQSNQRVAAGNFAARLTTNGASAIAQLRTNWADAAGSHQWEERPGTYRWQRAQLYIPASTVAQLGADEYLTLAGFLSSGANTGWYVRVRQNGQLYVVGHRDFDNAAIEFKVYGTVPTDRWFSLELGLHSQAGPGVKRAFSFLVDGDFYGWYHQGRMKDETYDRATFGILGTNSADGLELFVDQWRQPGSTAFPTGPDNRSTANLQEQNYRNGSGVQWQIDWTTWEYDLRLDGQYGLYSASNRLQSGRNLDRMPDLTSGWAEIEIDWVNGATPPNPTSEYFGAMVGFRKEINREENFEIIPYRDSADGKLYLVFEAWVSEAIILDRWPLPGNAVPGAGDIVRTRWEQVNATNLAVRASYYDASTNTWHNDILNWNGNVTNLVGPSSGNAADYTDGYHTASSVTIDSTYYSIRRFKVGTLETYP
jgi:hypothetical protein